MTDAIAQLHFLRPLWFLALPLLLALTWFALRRKPGGGAWGKVIAPALLPVLVQSPAGGATPSPTRLKFWVIAAALIICLALAGPTWEKIPLPVSKRDAALVILFDLSPSVLAEDIKPNRLVRARLKTIDLLHQYREGSAALVAWAGDAHVVAPLTEDTRTLIALLPVLHPDIMPQAGSSPELALEKGLELAMNAGYLEGDILFVTDGFTQQATEHIGSILRGFSGFRLSILGVGTDEGAPIPLGGNASGDTGFARDSRGGIVVAALRSNTLQGLAERNGGTYSTLSADDSDIQRLLSSLAEGHSDQPRSLERTLDTWEDKGPWLVLLLLPLAVLAFRRGLFALILVIPLLQAPHSQASLWDDLWRNRDQQGHKMIDDDPDRAGELFHDPRWRGVAAYRSGDFATAEQEFAGDSSAHGHYNRGNALARQGRLEDAIDAYQQALTQDPELVDAAANKRLLEELLQQQEQKQEQEQNGEQQQDKQSDDSSAQPQSQDSGQENDEDGDASDSGDSGDSGDNDDPGQADRQPEAQGDDSQARPDTGDSQSGDNGNQSPATSDSQHSADHPRSEADRPGEQGSAGDQSTADDQEADNQEADNQEIAAAEQPAGPGDTDREAAAADADSDGQPADQTLEQWLRRVPDDPGGLLRRKFEYQSRQNLLQQRPSRHLPPDQFQEERW